MRLLLPREQLETPHLPPISVAPILEHYDPELRQLSPEHRIAAPVDDRNIVQVFKTLDVALGEVDPEYIWPNDENDIHHFAWERSAYTPEANGGSKIPLQYREAAVHKGYLPRQLHNFLHVIIAPPPMPAQEVMKQRVDAYMLARRLFDTARLAAQYDKRPQAFMEVRRKRWRAMTVDESALTETMLKLEESYISRFDPEVFKDDAHLFDLTKMSPEPFHKAAKYLGRFAAINAINLKPYIYSDRGAPLAA